MNLQKKPYIYFIIHLAISYKRFFKTVEEFNKKFIFPRKAIKYHKNQKSKQRNANNGYLLEVCDVVYD